MWPVLLLFLWSAPPDWPATPRVEEVRVYGQTETPAALILRDLQIKPGTPLDLDRLLQERARLLRQGVYRRLEFQVRPGSHPDLRRVLLIVQERRGWSVGPSLSQDELLGWQAGLSLTGDNLFHRRNSMGVNAIWGQRHYVAAAWDCPCFAVSWRLFARLEGHYDRYPYRYDDFRPFFDFESVGLLATVGKCVGFKSRVGFRLGVNRVEVDEVSASQSADGQDDWISGALFVEYDSRDWPLFPKRGVWMRFSHTRFHRSGRQRYALSHGDVRAYWPVMRDNILAFQTVVTLSKGPLPVYRRFHLGGSLSLRGYRVGAFHGENRWLSSLEYRFPILYVRRPASGIHAGYNGFLFIDAGQAWEGHDTFGLHRFHGAVGWGVYFIWDRWVLRGEYGHHGRGWGWISASTEIKF